jgi:hypothetical protein
MMLDRRNGMPPTAKVREYLPQLLDEHRRDNTLPTNGRFLFYEGEARGWWPKSWERSGGPSGVVTHALMQLREAGDVPWDWIIDETREVEDWSGYPTLAEGVEQQLDNLRLDPWDGEAPFILMESRSLAGALRATCARYAVPFAATNGQVGGFLHTDVIPQLGPTTRILYLGDYDLAGNDIEANTRSVLEHEVGDLGLSEQWERLMLTEAQVKRHRLPKIIKKDKRFKNGGVHEAVETEALSQKLIVKLVRRRLDALLPVPLESVLEREATQRNKLRKQLERR